MNTLRSPNTSTHLRAALLLSLGGAVLTGCDTSPTPPEASLTGAYAIQQAGHYSLNLCFETPAGIVETIDLDPSTTFYAGEDRMSVRPQLVQESLPSATVLTAFETKQSTTVPDILHKIHDGALTPYTQEFKNSKVDLDCRKDFPGTLPSNFINNVDVLWWDGSNPDGLSAPSDGAPYSDDVPYDNISLKN
ncbi:MAG: hypothetical protein ACQR33_01165 [Candidatus Saccharibacteria bacterium]